MPIIVHIVNQKTGQDHGDNDKYHPAILKKTKGNTGIMREGKIQDIPDDRDGFVQIQKPGEKIFSQAVKKDDC